MLFSLLKNRSEVSSIDNGTDISRLSLTQLAGLSLQRGIHSLSPAFASLNDPSTGQEGKGGNAIIINDLSDKQDIIHRIDIEGSECRVLDPSLYPLTAPLELPNSPRSSIDQYTSPNPLIPSPSDIKIEVFQPAKPIQPIRKVYNIPKYIKQQN